MKNVSCKQGSLLDMPPLEKKTPPLPDMKKRMSKLERLIEELCPNGVEYKELKNILTIKNGKDYKEFEEGEVPVYGSGGIIAHIDTYVYDKPSVLIPRKGSLDKLYYVYTPFWTVDTIFYTVINSNIVIEKYVYYFIQNFHIEKLNTGGGVPSLTQSILNKILIPVPPLPVQEEIVRTLDTFSELNDELNDELNSELTKRKQQYKYYRDTLLNFSSTSFFVHSNKIKNLIIKLCPNGIKYKKLQEVIISLNTGLNPRQFFKLNTDDANNYYVTIREIHNNKIVFSEKTDKINDMALILCNNRSNLEVGDILFSGTGTIGETAIITDKPYNWKSKKEYIQ